MMMHSTRAELLNWRAPNSHEDNRVASKIHTRPRKRQLLRWCVVDLAHQWRNFRRTPPHTLPIKNWLLHRCVREDKINLLNLKFNESCGFTIEISRGNYSSASVARMGRRLIKRKKAHIHKAMAAHACAMLTLLPPSPSASPASVCFQSSFVCATHAQRWVSEREQRAYQHNYH